LKSEIDYKKYTEFSRQYREAEGFGKRNEIYDQSLYTSRLLDFPNLPKPQNNPSQQWQTSVLLDLQKLSIKKEIENIKEQLDNKSSPLIENFINDYKELIKNKDDKKMKNKERRELIEKLGEEVLLSEEKLKNKGLSEESIEKIIRYCETLVELEQKSEREGLQAQIQLSPKN